MTDFRIPYVGLKNGLHSFHFQIDDRFLSLFENSPIQHGKVSIDLTLDKRDSMFILIFKMDGSLQVECDRCTEEFGFPLHTENQIYVKFENEGDELDDETEVIYISRTETHIDVSQLIYEFVILGIPIQKVHPEDQEGRPGCNPDVLKYLNSNTEKSTEIDQRWSALMNLKTNKNK